MHRHPIMCRFGVAVFLIVAITAVAPEERNTTSVSNPARMSRREVVLLDNVPIENTHNYRRQSKIIYRRASRPKGLNYRKQNVGKLKYGPPRTKYGPPNNAHRPPKKHMGNPMKPKYGHRKSKPPKKYGMRPPRKHHRRPANGVFNRHAPYVPQEPIGFGEPPADYYSVNNKPRPSYGEPPTKPHGNPLSHTRQQSQNYFYNPSTFVANPQSHYASESHDNIHYQDYASNQRRPHSATAQDSYSNYSPEPSYAASSVLPKSQDTYMNNYSPEPSYAASAHAQGNVGSNYAVSDDEPGNDNAQFIDYTDQGTHSANLQYGDHAQHGSTFSPKPQTNYPNHQSDYRPLIDKKKPVVDTIKAINRPQKSNKGKKHPDEIIVGGQYAEPPARYVAKFKPSAQVYAGTGAFVPPQKMALDSDDSASSFQSSYVNYKNSNMAFSPQNLNDAFSVTST